MASYLDFTMMSYSYDFIDIRHFIDTCPLPLCYSSDGQKNEWKIGNPEEAQKNSKVKNFNLKARYRFLEFSYNMF